MTVQNYYALPETELEEAIEKIRQWLWNFPVHEERPRVLFALRVALNAREPRDAFVQTTIDILSKP